MKRTRNTLDDLLLLCISDILGKKQKCSYGNLVKKASTKYPEVFSLSDYPKWPDSLKLDRPLRQLRSERLITGSPTTFYSLTSLGKEKVRFLNNKRFPVKDNTSRPTRSPSLTFLKELENSDDFKDFASNKEDFKPNNMKIRALTRFTLETPKKVILDHLLFLKKTAHREKKGTLEDFLITYINYIERIK
ncbi:hypothetical protein HY388_02250 [Candidatus Daviesbacteria bacterium]|nr:hypothetical protein [Candidatus Daviesbacteria bacterium]